MYKTANLCNLLSVRFWEKIQEYTIHSVVSCDAYLQPHLFAKNGIPTQKMSTNWLNSLETKKSKQCKEELFQFQGQWKKIDIW